MPIVDPQTGALQIPGYPPIHPDIGIGELLMVFEPWHIKLSQQIPEYDIKTYLIPPFRAETEWYVLQVSFKHDRLWQITIHASPEDPRISQQDENEMFLYYQYWLNREIGTKRVFPWGTCDLFKVPWTTDSEIQLRYHF
jgi:hypothetical protein